MKNTFLRGERIDLLPVEVEDAPILAACNNDPDVRRSFFTHTPTSLAAQEERIKGLYAPGSDFIPFIIYVKDSEKKIGMTALHRVDLVSGAAIFSICLPDTEEWGKGYAKDATHLMMEYSFDVLNLHRIQLHVWEGNEAAVRAYKKTGFVEEGKLREAMKHNGEYCDFYVMGLLEKEWRSQQSS